MVDNLREKRAITITGYIVIRSGCKLLLSRTFSGTMEVVCKHFDLAHEKELDLLNNDLLWDQFEDGHFNLICQIGKRRFYFNSPEGRQGRFLTFSTVENKDAAISIAKHEFDNIEDYVRFCQNRVPVQKKSIYTLDTVMQIEHEQKRDILSLLFRFFRYK